MRNPFFRSGDRVRILALSPESDDLLLCDDDPASPAMFLLDYFHHYIDLILFCFLGRGLLDGRHGGLDLEISMNPQCPLLPRPLSITHSSTYRRHSPLSPFVRPLIRRHSLLLVTKSRLPPLRLVRHALPLIGHVRSVT